MSSGTPPTVILPDPDFCDVRLYEHWDEILPRVRREVERRRRRRGRFVFPGRDCCPRRDCRRRRSGQSVLRHRYSDHGGSASRARKGRLHREPPDSGSSTSISASPVVRCCARSRSAFGAPRAVPLYCSFDPDEYRRLPVNRRLRLRLELHGNVCSRSPAEARRVAVRSGARARRQEIHRGRTAISSGRCAGPPMCEHIRSSQSAVASRNFIRHRDSRLNVTRRDMAMAGLLALGASVRSGRLRSNDHLRQLAGAGQFFRAGRGDSAACTTRTMSSVT